jgi:hypothetical protein
MIILRSEPLTNDYSVREIAEFDTKAAILKSFEILHRGVAKSYRKGELAWLLDHLFNENPALFANILPEEEQKLLSRLICLQQHEYIEAPVDKYQHLLMQKLHIVLNYQVGNIWHIYMPDQIRKRFDKMAAEDIHLYPELEELYKVLEQITEHRIRLFELMDKNNPDTLTPQRVQIISVEVNEIAKFYTDVKPRLKKLEPYIKKNTSTSLKAAWQDIENAEMFLAIVKATLSLKRPR